MPDIDRQIEKELATRIEKRIKELMPVAHEPEEPHDITSIVTHMETDWRRLLVGRKQLLQMPVRDLSGSALPEVRPEEVRLNIVGVDGQLPPTPAPPDDARSHVSESSLPPPPLTPEVGFN